MRDHFSLLQFTKYAACANAMQHPFMLANKTFCRIIIVIDLDFAIIFQCKKHWAELCFSSHPWKCNWHTQNTLYIRSSFQSIFIDVQHMKNGCFSSTKLIVGSLSLPSTVFRMRFMCSCFCSRFCKCSQFLPSRHVADGFYMFRFLFSGYINRIRCDANVEQFWAMHLCTNWIDFQPQVITYIYSL